MPWLLCVPIAFQIVRYNALNESCSVNLEQGELAAQFAHLGIGPPADELTHVRLDCARSKRTKMTGTLRPCLSAFCADRALPKRELFTWQPAG